jgi:hypothetical protein
MARVGRWPLLHTCLAFVLVIAASTPGSRSRAGECTESAEYYVADLEAMVRNGPPFHSGEPFDCLTMRCEPEDWKLWAGPIAAHQFEKCRTHPLRDRIAAACVPLLADTARANQYFSIRDEAAHLAASYGFTRIGDHDLFVLITEQIRTFSTEGLPRFPLLAIMRDPRTLRFLTAFYASLSATQSPERDRAVFDLLSCLYHVPGDSAVSLASQVLRNEKSPILEERARRVVDR